jgi:RsiW-degrading membrane proteinase PrsW (M82 family)
MITLITPVLIAPVVEEVCKFIPVRFGVYYLREFDEPMDGIVYAAAVALGFAAVENVLYVTGAYSRALATDPAGAFGEARHLLFMRAIYSTPGHVIDSAVWGAALGWAKFAKPGQRARPILLALAMGMGLHAAWNALSAGARLLPEEGALAEILGGVLGMLLIYGVMQFGWFVTAANILSARDASPFRGRRRIRRPPPRGLLGKTLLLGPMLITAILWLAFYGIPYPGDPEDL